MLNKVILIGNLGRDPEMKFLPSGMEVCNFSLATQESRKDKDGNREKHTEWHQIVTFGKLAKVCGEYLTKGKQVYVEGRIQTRSWEDKDGNKRYSTEIVVNDMKMLGGRSEQKAEATPDESEPPF